MKAFIVASVILILIISVAVTLTCLSNGASDSLGEAAEKAYAADGINRAAASDALYSLWMEKRGLFALSIEKGDVEEIDFCLSTLRELTLHPHSESDFFTLCQRAKEALGILKSYASPTLYGIF